MNIKYFFKMSRPRSNQNLAPGGSGPEPGGPPTTVKTDNDIISSSDPNPQYQNGHGEAVPVPPPHGPRDEQTEPVDFSTANEPVNFSGVRPVATFAGGPVLAPGSGYSRESTPDSGGSHYMDAYRDPAGKISTTGGSAFLRSPMGTSWSSSFSRTDNFF